MFCEVLHLALTVEKKNWIYFRIRKSLSSRHYTLEYKPTGETLTSTSYIQLKTHNNVRSHSLFFVYFRNDVILNIGQSAHIRYTPCATLF